MEIILFIQSFKNPVLDIFFQIVTMSGEESFFILAASWIIWCFDKQTGRRIGWIFLTGTVFNGALKDIFMITRPIGHESVVSMRTETAGGFAFPSGHTQGTAMLWFSLMKVYRKKALYISGGMMIVLVAISRMYLGVHWPADVAGGILFGLLWVFIADYIWIRFDIASSILKIGAVSGLLIMCSLIFTEANIIRSTGAAVGFLTGIFFEDRYVRHAPAGKYPADLLKMLIGLTVLFAVMTGLKLLLPDDNFFRGIRYGFIGLWITLGAPFLFTKIFRYEKETPV
jgi:membrane-associated phospholipid phosphatase